MDSNDKSSDPPETVQISTPESPVQNDNLELTIETKSDVETEPTSQSQDIQKQEVEVTETSPTPDNVPDSSTPDTQKPHESTNCELSTETDKPKSPPVIVVFPKSDSAVSFLVTKEDEGNSNAIVESCVAEPILTLEKLVDLCSSNPTVQSAHFALGLPPNKERFNFHQVIHLPNLTKLSIELPRIKKMSRKHPPIPSDFKRLIYFLKQIEFENLQTIDISCSTEQAACIPLASAFVPCYELTDYSPLADLICRNRTTLKLLTLGRSPNHQVQITLNPKECNAICEPMYYPKIENFTGIPNFPVLSSWSVMLRPQRHLKKLSMAFVDQEVWDFVCEGIENSSDTVTSVNFMAFGIKSVPLDLIYFKRCISLSSFTLRYYGFSILGWEYLPGGIKHLHLGGKVSTDDVEKMITAMPLLEDVCIELKKNYFRDVDGKCVRFEYNAYCNAM